MSNQDQRRYEITAVEPDEFSADLFTRESEHVFDVKIRRDGAEHSGRIAISSEVIIVLNSGSQMVQFGEATIIEDGQANPQPCEGFFTSNTPEAEEPFRLVSGMLFVSGEKN